MNEKESKINALHKEYCSFLNFILNLELLNKFSKTQEKLDQLKRVQKKANQIKVNNVPKPDKITVSNKIEERVTKLKVESSKDAENQKFNPHKVIT